MADVQRTVEVLSLLNSSDLDAEWVKSVWDKDFTELDPLRLDTQEYIQSHHYHCTTLSTTIKALVPWVRGDEGRGGEGFWSVLVENNISHKHIIALLFYLMEIGSKRVSNCAQKEAAILAADVYFSFTCIPGSRAFKVFHPYLFQKAVDMFKIWSHLEDNKRKRREPSAKSQPNKKGKPSKRAKNTENIDDQEEDGLSSNDEDDVIMTTQEMMKLRGLLVSFLKDFVRFLTNYSIKDSESSSQHALLALIELTRLQPDSLSEEFDLDIDVSRVTSVPQLAYMGLNILSGNCNDDTTVTMIFKHLLPSVLMLMGENKTVALQTIPRPTQLVKDQAVHFVRHVIQTKGNPVLVGVRTLLQHLCVKVPDKAEYRTKVAQAILYIMKDLPILDYARMVQWIYRFSRNAKAGYRVFGLDLACLLLNEPEHDRDNTVSDDVGKFLTHKFLIQDMMLSRCSDEASTVRARAIMGFATLVASEDPVILRLIRDIMTPHTTFKPPVPHLVPTPHILPGTGTTVGDTEQDTGNETAVDQSNVGDTAGHMTAGPTPGNLATPVQTTPGVVDIVDGSNLSLSDVQGVMSMLRRRASDLKVNVRKAALHALENIIKLEGAGFQQLNLDVLHERCMDPALSVKKQSMHSLTDLLLSMPNVKPVQVAWLDGILPLVIDKETSLQEKSVEVLADVLLSALVPYHRSTATNHQLVWDLLDILAGAEGDDLRRFLKKTCQQWSKIGKIKPNLVTSLQSHVGTEHNTAVWMILAEVSSVLPKFNPDFLVEYWQRHARTTNDLNTLQRVLVVLGNTAKNMSPEHCRDLAGDLLQRLKRFDSPPELISITVTTLSKLCSYQGIPEDQSQEITSVWWEDLLKSCDLYLSTVILNEHHEEAVDESKVIRHLFTLGEIAQLCPAKTPRRAFMLVQSLIAGPCITSIDGSSQPSQPLQFSQLSQSSQSQGTQAMSQFTVSRMSSTVRAHAFITLGKLCLQNEDIAKKCVPAMARELETCPDPAIRNNVVIVLCDLCIRYTSLVDRYVPNIAACLKDESPLIRKQTLTLLTRLLQEDFLKWRGPLFFRFIISIVDTNTEIQQFAEFCLKHILLQRNPGMFFNHFVECIFHFNSYKDHKAYNKFQQSDCEKTKFSLHGKENRAKRMYIYRFMLEHMTDDHRFNLLSKLCQEVLCAIVDNVIPLNADTGALLQDTLAILSSKEIKLVSMKAKADDINDEQDMAAAILEKAKKTIISKVIKKNVIENIIPVIICLKQQLEKNHSPLLRDLMICIQELMKDYKTEIKDILAADRQMASEIEFDLRKFEEEQKAEQENNSGRRSATPFGRVTPGNRTPAQGNQTPKGVSSPRAPVLNIMNAVKTPSRRSSMVTVDIINTVRRAMESAKIASDPKTPRRTSLADKTNTPLSGRTRKSLASGGKKVEFQDELIEKPMSTEVTFKTPQRPERTSQMGDSRAISTPNITLGNITFQQGEHNLSVIPPSPIPSAIPLRLYPDDTDRTKGPTNNVPNETPVDIICMFSPDKPTPKPKKWNIRPTSKQKTESEQKTNTSTRHLSGRLSKKT